MKKPTILMSAMVLVAMIASQGLAAAPEGMVWIPSGEFRMGSDDPLFPDAQPVHRVWVDGFWMDETDVTNEQFARFIDATSYVTIAEQTPKAEDFPGVPADKLVAGWLAVQCQITR